MRLVEMTVSGRRLAEKESNCRVISVSLPAQERLAHLVLWFEGQYHYSQCCREEADRGRYVTSGWQGRDCKEKEELSEPSAPGMDDLAAKTEVSVPQGIVLK